MTDSNQAASPAHSAANTTPTPASTGAGTPTGNANAAAMSSSLESSGTVSNMADLKEQAPEVYKAMMQGVAMNICREMQHHQARLKEIMRKARQDASG